MIRKWLLTLASTAFITTSALGLWTGSGLMAGDLAFAAEDEEIIEITDSSDTEDGSDEDDDDIDEEEENNNKPPDNQGVYDEQVNDLGETDDDDGSAYSYQGSDGGEHVRDRTPETADFPVGSGFFFAGGLLCVGFAFLLLSRNHIAWTEEPEPYDDSLD